MTRLRSPKVISALAATWLIWGSTYLVIRFAIAGFPPLFMTGTRFFVAGALLLLYARLTGRPLPTGREWGVAIVLGALILGCGMGGTATAEMSIGSGLVVAFVAITPVLLMLANLAYGIRPARRELLGIFVGLAGVIMLTQGASYQASAHGLLALVVGCVGWTMGSVLSQRSLRLAPGIVGFGSEMLCGGALVLIVSRLAGEGLPVSIPASAWAAWCYLVVFGSLVAFNAYMFLLGEVSAGIATSYTYVNPVIGLLLGTTLGREMVTPWEWLSVLVTLTGLVIVMWRRDG
jgi:drug/metabolite transporter (DMT)-like permease